MESVISSLNPTSRFSNRVENYVKYRPGYPMAIVNFLEQAMDLNKEKSIVDIGSGTGLFSELLLSKGYTVNCIEPNEEMRQAGDRKLGHFPGYSSTGERAESTGLPDASVDLVTVAQAFHWIDPVLAKKEFSRILRPDGHIVIAYNLRQTNSVFMQGYEDLRNRFALEKELLQHVSEEEISRFFSPATLQVQQFANIQWLDFDSLKGQLLSSSYIPLPGHPSYDTMIDTLVKLFVANNKNGFVQMNYETKLYWCQLS